MPKSIKKYENERKEILQKIFNILEITDDNKMVSLKKLDGDENKQNSIIELEPDIKKYFLCSRWTYFCNKNRDIKRGYLSLIKAIMKNLNVKMTSSTLIKKIDDTKTKCETYYIFEY
jgi:hypothetical protein